LADGKHVSTVEESFVCAVISNSFLTRMFELLECFDEDVCNLLLTIALQPFGTQLLISEGIGGALKSAAKSYAAEYSAMTMKENYGFQRADVRTPTFFRAHLKLLCALLSNVSEQVPKENSMEFAFKCLDIVATYTLTIERICYNFPMDIEDLFLVLRCLVLTCSLAQPVRASYLDDGDFKRKFEQAGLLGPSLKSLVEQLLESPLPEDMLTSDYPRELTSKSGTTSSSVVRVEIRPKQSWWEMIPVRDAKYHFEAPVRNDFNLASVPLKEWTEHTYENGIASSQICAMGLELFKRMDINIDAPALARGLFRTVFASGIVAGRETQLRSRRLSSFMDTEDNQYQEVEEIFVGLLANAFAQCTEQALTLALASSGKENEPRDLVVAAVSCMSGALYLPEERREFITILCEEVVRGNKH
jgi:hypothetical protein